MEKLTKELKQQADNICLYCDGKPYCTGCIIVLKQDNQEIQIDGDTRAIREVKTMDK